MIAPPTAAHVLGGHTAVVWLANVPSCVALTHVQPTSEDQLIPDQPDGISNDSRDLPDPHRAVTRIREWIATWGDGLIDTADGCPLYARDLEAVTRAVLATPATETAPSHTAAELIDQLAADRDQARAALADVRAASTAPATATPTPPPPSSSTSSAANSEPSPRTTPTPPASPYPTWPPCAASASASVPRPAARRTPRRPLRATHRPA
ncbi:hypothetical protein HCB17_04380 [Salinispora arenicola]|uniref:hypothetical protein n=1 Tax=Salinispora arenicola TaxID=168697 RepID=UPI001430691F|nr:hypothetical protein [Salinispora arenicola]NIL40489.1 hypothetical protein [Salinispora arenicola]